MSGNSDPSAGTGGPVVIIDYGMGNLFSVKKRVDKLSANVKVSGDPVDILSASKLILPGVGHFDLAMKNLDSLGLKDALNEAVLEKKTPILGICLGMQLMARHSEEGDAAGLGWIDADVVKFKVEDRLNFKIPHTGWNNVASKKESRLMKNISGEPEVYFVHAYYMRLNDPQDALHETVYETPFISAVEKDNIVGVQYHPEKSHESGEQMLKNFIEQY